jgi:ribonuclease HI
MELTAAIEALRYLRDLEGTVNLYSDSTYVVRGMSEWINSWKRRGWRTTEGNDVLNRDLWESIDGLVAERSARGAVTWRHVPGHAGIAGNERADEIARAHAAGRQIELYRGPLRDYQEGVFPLPENIDVAATMLDGKRRGTGKGKANPAHSYLSVVDGKPMRHATWADCERRVKGKSHALFKKATSPGNEVEILRAWGYSVEDL